MGRRRKTRTHVEKATSEDPKSFIIKHGPVGASVTQLVRDFRKVMEPNTASRLRERNRNKLKDYLTIAPTLQVSHLLAFTLTPVAPSLRLIRLPAGPTLSFRIERYSLMKDLLNASKRPRSIGMEYLSPPLVVLASFPSPSPSTPAHIPLLVKAFQSLFPSLSPKTLTLSSARRVVLISYNSDRQTIDFRHYIITVKPYGVSSRVRKLLDGSSSKHSSSGFLDLGSEKDVADFLLRKRGEAGPDGGYESAASSTESVAGDDAAVDLADDYVGRNNKKGQKRAVKLDEVGPRMELRLLKITEGPPGREGAVLYHQFVKKTKKEIAEQTAAHAAKEKLRKERREEQERNVARKKALAEDPVSEEAESDADHDDVGEWDEDEEISEDEEDDEEDDEVHESDEEEQAPPIKRLKTRSNKR